MELVVYVYVYTCIEGGKVEVMVDLVTLDYMMFPLIVQLVIDIFFWLRQTLMVDESIKLFIIV